jgi:pimeloyl-ACP methyl ester carboxylesterase
MHVDAAEVRDVVVVVPGIMGSELFDAKNRPVWSVSAGGLVHAIRTFGRSLRKLELDKCIGDHCPTGEKAVTATALVKSLHVIPGLWSPIVGYDGLLDFLRSSRFNLVEKAGKADDRVPNLIPFPYDWRLSNRYNAKRLEEVAVPALERWRRQPGMGDAKLVLVCHSMGGLIARWFAEKEGGADLIRAMITIGTPHRGAANSLATLVNGLEPKFGPVSISLTDFARSLPSLYQLLPQYACVLTDAGRVPIATAGCADLNSDMLEDATKFHRALASDQPPSYPLYKVVGIRQPTVTTARFAGRRVTLLPEIDGKNQGGDGTVPQLAAEPTAGRGTEVHPVAGQHGHLQVAPVTLDLLDRILTREEIIWQAPSDEPFGVEMRELWTTAEEPSLCVTELNDRRMSVAIQDEMGRLVGYPVEVREDGTAQLGALPEGGYCAIISATRKGGPPPIMKSFVVLDSSPEAV